MNAQVTTRSKQRSKLHNICWDKETSDKVVNEFHRLRKEGSSVKEAFEQCQAVIEEEDWKTLKSLQNYFYRRKLQLTSEEAIVKSASIAVNPGAPLPVLPIGLAKPEEDRPAVTIPQGTTMEAAIAEFIKGEISAILSPVREAAKKFRDELELQTAELQKPGGAIRFFARSLEEEEAASTELPTTPVAITKALNRDPLAHTVGIIGLLDSQVSTVKSKFRGSKLYLRFTSKDNIRQAVNSVKNMSHIIVFSTKVSHSLTKAIDGRGLKDKVTYISGMTSLEEALREIEKKVAA